MDRILRIPARRPHQICAKKQAEINVVFPTTRWETCLDRAGHQHRRRKRLTVLAMAVSRGSIIGCNVPIASPQVRPKERGISTSRVGSTASGAGDTLPDPAEPRQRARIDHGHWRIEPVVVVSFEFTLPILAQPFDTTCPSRLSMTQFLAARRIGRDNALHQARPVGFSSLLFFLVTFTSKRPRPWSVDFVDPESCVRWRG